MKRERDGRTLWRPPATPRRRDDWCCAIARADLDASAKLIAFVLTEWADWRTGGNLFPSVGLIAERTNRSAHTVSTTIRRLEQLGVLTFVRRSRGRGTHLMKLEWEGLVALCDCANPQKTSELNPQDSSALPPRNRGVTPQKQRGNCEVSWEEHITQQMKDHSIHHPKRSAVLDGGLQPGNSQTLEHLRSMGVSDRMARRLASEHPRGRIAAIIAECQTQKPPPLNPAGWIVSALGDPARTVVLDYRAKSMQESQVIADALEELPDWAIEKARGDPVSPGTLRQRYTKPSNHKHAWQFIDRVKAIAAESTESKRASPPPGEIPF